MKALRTVFIAMLVVGCGEHSLPREASSPTDGAEEAARLEELDSVARAAVLMMRSCFQVIDSSMKAGEPEEIRSVPVFKLDSIVRDRRTENDR
jgi:hypothetical protein